MEKKTNKYRGYKILIKLTNSEKDLVKRAIVATKIDFNEADLSPEKNEDLILILNMYRARAYITPRMMDNGKEFDTWIDLRNKLGQPVETKEEIILKHERIYADGVLKKLNEVHDVKISRLERRLKTEQANKLKSQTDIEDKLQAQADLLEKERTEQLRKLEIAKKARGKLKLTKKLEEIKDDKSDKGQTKCWICGGWYREGAGIKSHVRACKKKHPDAIKEV